MSTDSPPLEALVERARKNPRDEASVSAAARALSQAGRYAEAFEVLSGLVNVTAHEESPLPPLSKRAIDPGLGLVRVDGVEYERLFSVSGGRVLYYWAPSELRDRYDEITRDVGERLGARVSSNKPLKPRA